MTIENVYEKIIYVGKEHCCGAQGSRRTSREKLYVMRLYEKL